MREVHLAAYRKLQLNVVAITNRTATAALETAAQYGIQRVYDSYQ